MEHFKWNERLGIALPFLIQPWESYARHQQEAILAQWEIIRGQIPNRIFALEQEINLKQARLFHETDFGRACRLNGEIAELASIINDLQIWNRTGEDVTADRAHR